MPSKRPHLLPDQYAYECDFWLIRDCKLTKQTIEQLVVLLTSLTNSYRLLVISADEFNRMSLAKRSQVEDAVSRANRLGKLIDRIIRQLDRRTNDYFDALAKCDLDVELVRPKIPRPSFACCVFEEDGCEESADSQGIKRPKRPLLGSEDR